MAATLALESVGNVGGGGNEVLGVGTLTIGTYATGGVAVTVSGQSTAVERIAYLNGQGGGYVCEWVPSTQKLKVYRQKDPAAAGGADIALPEVANTVDLSGVSFPALMIGQ